MTTLETLRDRVQRDFTREQLLIDIHDVILGVLKEKWVGKKINKRLETQVKDRLVAQYGDGVIVYYTGRSLKVWGIPNLDVKHGYPEFYFGHKETIDPEYFENDADGCHGVHARKRNVNRKWLLDNTLTLWTLANKIDARTRLEEEIADLTAYETPGYEVQWIAKEL